MNLCIKENSFIFSYVFSVRINCGNWDKRIKIEVENKKDLYRLCSKGGKLTSCAISVNYFLGTKLKFRVDFICWCSRELWYKIAIIFPYQLVQQKLTLLQKSNISKSFITLYRIQYKPTNKLCLFCLQHGHGMGRTICRHKTLFQENFKIKLCNFQ